MIDSIVFLFVVCCEKPSGNWGHRNQFECAPWNQTWPVDINGLMSGGKRSWSQTDCRKFVVKLFEAAFSFVCFQRVKEWLSLDLIWILNSFHFSFEHKDWAEFHGQFKIQVIKDESVSFYCLLAELKIFCFLSPLCLLLPRCPWSRYTVYRRIGSLSEQFNQNIGWRCISCRLQPCILVRH